jgi:hypothetical protein
MGLLTDSFFVKAIKSNTDLMEMLPAGDIYNNVADPDYDMENVPIPYIIVNNDGGSEGDTTKDSWSESVDDKVNISILMVANNRDELADITLAVRKTVTEYIKAAWLRIQSGSTEEGDDIAPTEYNFSFSDIAFDMSKPACRQMFYYDCVTPNEIYIEEDDEQENENQSGES